MAYQMLGCTVYFYIVSLGVNVRFCRRQAASWVEGVYLGRVFPLVSGSRLG